MPGPNGEDGFAAVLGRAQKLPTVNEDAGKDLPDGFPIPSGLHHRVVDTSNDPTAIEGLIAYDFTVHRGVYMIYRPWESCRRCLEAIGNNMIQPPVDGDMTCTHTQMAAYEAVINRTLSGEFLAGSEQDVIQKDGSIVVSVKWYEKKLNPRRAKKAGPSPTMPGQKDEPDL